MLLKTYAFWQEFKAQLFEWSWILLNLLKLVINPCDAQENY